MKILFKETCLLENVDVQISYNKIMLEIGLNVYIFSHLSQMILIVRFYIRQSKQFSIKRSLINVLFCVTRDCSNNWLAKKIMEEKNGRKKLSQLNVLSNKSLSQEIGIWLEWQKTLITRPYLISNYFDFKFVIITLFKSERNNITFRYVVQLLVLAF